jgi:hypothetical protein
LRQTAFNASDGKTGLVSFPLHKAPYSNLNGFDLKSKEDWILNPFLRSVSLVSFLILETHSATIQP